MIKKTLLEHQPWHISYQRAAEARPSWSKHGMPALFGKFVKMVRKNSSDGLHVDIGCGNGVKTVNFALEGFNTVGVDISEDGFKEARELIKELRIGKLCKVIKGSCLDLPILDNTATSASDILCFTHLKTKDQKKYKKELGRVLANKGEILLVLFSDKDKHFHGHKISKKYTFKFDPANPLMEGYSHYQGMFNFHFNKKDIKGIFFPEFKIVEAIEVTHPIYPHRFLWNVILKKKDAGKTR